MTFDGNEFTVVGLTGLDKIKDDRERFKTIEKRQKEIVAACEKDRAGIRCSTASFYEGWQWLAGPTALGSPVPWIASSVAAVAR